MAPRLISRMISLLQEKKYRLCLIRSKSKLPCVRIMGLLAQAPAGTLSEEIAVGMTNVGFIVVARNAAG